MNNDTRLARYLAAEDIVEVISDRLADIETTLQGMTLAELLAYGLDRPASPEDITVREIPAILDEVRDMLIEDAGLADYV